jgi:methylthioribose-1-phosphate isomerase
MAGLQAIRYSRGKLEVLDQLRLPHEHHYDVVSTSEEAFDCIKSMRVRGMGQEHHVQLVNDLTVF